MRDRKGGGSVRREGEKAGEKKKRRGIHDIQ